MISKALPFMTMRDAELCCALLSHRVEMTLAWGGGRVAGCRCAQGVAWHALTYGTKGPWPPHLATCDEPMTYDEPTTRAH